MPKRGGWRAALGDELARVQAADLIRKLADKIVLTPVASEEGHNSLSIDPHGHRKRPKPQERT
jgi:hypothetical protein